MSTQRKTHANAFAKSFCHRCLDVNRSCDRQRPRCRQCIAEGVVCSGYKQELSWTNSIATRGKDSGKSVPAHLSKSSLDPTAPSPSTSSQQEWRFVNDGHKSKRRRKRKPNPPKIPLDVHLERRASEDAVSKWASHDTQSFEPSLLGVWSEPEDWLSQDSHNSIADLLDTWTESQNTEEVSSHILLSETDKEATIVQSSLGEHTLPHQPELSDSHGDDETKKGGTESNITTLPLRDKTLPQPWQELLHYYDTDFCGTPVTTDFAENPYRHALSLALSSPAVLHAILGFSAHHRGRLRKEFETCTVLHHKSESMIHLSAALENPDPCAESPIPLTTMILLISLDATQSGQGSWGVHLRGASNLLKQRGDRVLLNTDMPFRGQTAMLLWWDLTLAMISRQAPLLPESYVRSFIKQASAGSDLDFFNLVGCQEDIFGYLSQTVQIACRLRAGGDAFEIVKQIQEIEESLLDWKLPLEFNTSRLRRLTSRQLEYTMNRIHATEAWRWAILLYIQQIFRGGKASEFYRHQIFDHAKCITRNAQDRIQKQILLPLFLAGAQTASSEACLRGFVMDLCAYWGIACRFGMFDTVAALLQCIWDKMDSSEEPVFWGDVLDNMGGSFLLG